MERMGVLNFSGDSTFGLDCDSNSDLRGSSVQGASALAASSSSGLSHLEESGSSELKMAGSSELTPI